MTETMERVSRRRPAVYSLISLLVLSLCLVAVFRARLVDAKDQDIQKLNRFVQSTKGDTPAMRMFREGRDSIEGQNWQKASAIFHDFITNFPKDKDLDAALYWLGYSLQKQGKSADAAVPLERLIKEFPSSSWRREAEAMLVVLGRREAIQQALERDNCEIKILALQSLFQANEDRAISFVTEVLKTSPAQCPGLTAAAVSLLGSHGGARAVPLLLDVARNNPDMKLRLTAIRRLGDQNDDAIADELARLYDADRSKEVRSQILRALAQMHSARAETKLIELARAGDDLSLRQLAVRYLGEQNGSASLDELIRLFDAERTPEIRMQIIRALSQRNDPRAHAKLVEIAHKGDTPELRIEAIRRLGDRGRVSIDELLDLYSGETNVAIKQGLIRTYAEMKDPRALTKLYEIARTSDNLDLRLYAIRRLGDKNDVQTTEQLVAMYDSEPNVQVKAALIRAFGDSKEKVAVHKLMTIARGDQSVDLRKLAVRLLGESKDPEALKFLEDLLK